MPGTPVFPDDCIAAVSLTYDDGLPQHLDAAAPDLDAAGLRGTFYVPTQHAPAWAARPGDWRALAARGHEVGNHTRFHPCAASHGAWLKPQYALEAYDLPRMEQELREASAELAAIVGDAAERSYAYTCCEDFVGPGRASYRPLVARLFPAARGGGKGAVADPRACDLAFVPSHVVEPPDDAAALVRLVDRAVERGGWAVFQFHGVGGGHRMDCPRAAHRALCDHVVGLRGQVWCDTFLNVARAVARARG